MPEVIESAVVGGHRYAVGERVCITGRGTAAIVHIHGRVRRFTKTVMTVEFRGYRSETYNETRRYRVGDASGLEVGSGGYGGSWVHPTCQRPKTT